MKRSIIVIMVLSLFATHAFSQQRMNREEMLKRQKEQQEQLKKDLELNKEQSKKFDELQKKFNEQRDKMREGMRSGGGDFQEMRKKMDEMNKNQTTELKKILTEEQAKKYDAIMKKREEERANRRGGRGQGDGQGRVIR